MVMRDPPTEGEGPTRKTKAVLEGLQLVSTAAKRVWQELYVCKKPVSNLCHPGEWGGGGGAQ